jgi:hypothetical protein
MRNFRSLGKLAAFVAGVVLAANAAAGAPGNAGGLFVVADAVDQFATLKHHAEAVGYVLPAGAPDASPSNHYQGVLRHPRTGIPPVFYLTQSSYDGEGQGISAPPGGGYLHVVQLGTRDTLGERLRSNVQRPDAQLEYSLPPRADTWVRSIRIDGSLRFGNVQVPWYRHPGAMAIVDDVLFVPVDQPHLASSPTGWLLLFDVGADPLAPQPLRAFELEHAIDNVAVTRRADGSWLVWTNGGGGSEIHVYRIDAADLRADEAQLQHVQRWTAATGLRQSSGQSIPPLFLETFWPQGFNGVSSHQSSTFVREPDGRLYLIGIHQRYERLSDRAGLYLVDESGPTGFELIWVNSREFNCVYDGGGTSDTRVCNFAAASSAYVSPSGELMFYSAPHDDQDGYTPNFVRFGEFRHRDANREDSALRRVAAVPGGPYAVSEGDTVVLDGAGLPSRDRPWVELYDNTGWGDRSIVVDYDDRARYELANFDDLDGFGDKTSSVRWRSPAGLDVLLYADAGFSGRYVVLKGTGRTEWIADLDSASVRPGVVEHRAPTLGAGASLDFGDETSSLRWVGVDATAVAPNLDWDLDGDGLYGEFGTAAARGAETGGGATFSAALVDGPATLTLALRATSADADSSTATTTVQVSNVAPDVHPPVPNGGLPGVGLVNRPVQLQAAFWDVPADTQTATVAWGDGTTSTALLDDAADTLTATRNYAAPGAYTVTVTVRDDDGGVGVNSAPLLIYDPPGALREAVRRIDELLAGTLPADTRQLLEEVRRSIVGGNNGQANDGALFALGLPTTAPVLLRLARADAALAKIAVPDVQSIRALVQMVAASLA